MEINHHNTLGLSATVPEITEIAAPEELEELFLSASAGDRRAYHICGELTNTVLGEKVDQPVVLFKNGERISLTKVRNGIRIEVDGSLHLDRLVQRLCEESIAGMELLSGIPGTVGAGIIQNVAAYGQQISTYFKAARAIDLETGSVVDLSASDFRFSYRDSQFKVPGRYTPRIIVLKAFFEFPCPSRPEPVSYTDLVDLHRKSGRDNDSLLDRRTTVLEIRERKGMVVGGRNWVPSAGSYFLSPVLPWQTALQMAQTVRGERFAQKVLSWYRPDTERNRISAALVLRAGGFMNGDRWGNVGLSPCHILALTAYPGATGSDVIALSRLMQERIYEQFGLLLQPEVCLLGSFSPVDLSVFIATHPFTPGTVEPEWAVALGKPDMQFSPVQATKEINKT